MSGYEWFYQSDQTDQVSLLQSIKTGIDSLADKEPSCIVSSKLLVLDSAYKTLGSNENPSYSIDTISCLPDEYMTLTLLRANFYHDFPDIPANSQIRFTKTGQTPMTITLDRYGKVLINNLATAVYNKYHIPTADMLFDMTYDSSLGSYKLVFGTETTMEVLTEDLARYMNVAVNTPITSVNNVIYTNPVRPQKTINIA